MLRVGLTGDLGSGKSTVGAMLAAGGAIVLSSDEMARAMMQPGQSLYNAIVAHFGPTVLAPDKSLNRRALAQLAFDPKHPRVEELNALVHPAVIEAQAEQIALLTQTNPRAIVVVESALIFTALAGSAAWKSRFDRVILVTAPRELKIARFVERIAAGRDLSETERKALEDDARERLAIQHSEDFAGECLVIRNDGGLQQLEFQVGTVWEQLQALAGQSES
jgi:dephospho-CoA kinase